MWRQREPRVRLPLPRKHPAMCATSRPDRKSTRLNSSHGYISYVVFCMKKKRVDQPGHSQFISRLKQRSTIRDDSNRSSSTTTNPPPYTSVRNRYHPLMNITVTAQQKKP